MAAKPSKFSSIFVTPQDPEPEETVEETPTQAIVMVPESASVAPVETSDAKPTLTGETSDTETAARTKTGKKSNPDYKQVTAYVRRDLHENVTSILFNEAIGRKDTKRKEFSELVDELLEQWLQRRRGSSGHNDTFG